MAGSSPIVLRAATTSSVKDSGLLDALASAFTDWSGLELAAEAVGTGDALGLGRRGEVDVTITHDRGWELKFVQGGHGVNRREFMTNDFILVGPPKDPAKVGKAESIHDALDTVFRSGSPFLSRGDDSGTNLREVDLWAAAGLNPFGRPWYQAVRGGMVRCLEEASARGAYTLSDSATFRARGDRLKLARLCTDPGHLRNAYSVIAVNPARHPQVNYEGAMSLVTFLTGAKGQQLIRNFRAGGHPLFVPLWEPLSEGESPAADKKSPDSAPEFSQGDRLGLVR